MEALTVEQMVGLIVWCTLMGIIIVSVLNGEDN